MRYEVKYGPSYAVALVSLDGGESIQAESGAMVSMSSNVELKAEMKGGFLGALSRSLLGGESFFTSRYTAMGGPGELTLAPTRPGDVTGLELAGETYFVQSGSYLGGHPDLSIDTKFGGARSFFAGEGLFLLKVTGSGPLLLSSYGAIHPVDIQPGQRYVVDTGHIVAFSESLSYNVTKAAKGLGASIASGEGLVAQFSGHGRLFIQTRNERALVNWLIPMLPQKG